MKPLIKDEPREWRKFMLQFCGLGVLISIFLAYRGVLTIAKLAAIGATLVAVAWVAVGRPHWFRAFYHLSMNVSAWLGERISEVVLTVLFLTFVTPLGLILRLFGHDLLARQRRSAANSYWQPVRRQSRLDRMH